MAYLGAIDQGTTSTRFIVFDHHGSVKAVHQVEYEQIYPQPGWCEHDPLVIMETVSECISETCKKMEALGLDPKQIQGEQFRVGERVKNVQKVNQ